MTKLLVMGGAGCIGFHMVDLPIDHCFEVAILDELSARRGATINPHGREKEQAV
jgi:nucleoside-diphosphate-sugar epimerase